MDKKTIAFCVGLIIMGAGFYMKAMEMAEYEAFPYAGGIPTFGFLLQSYFIMKKEIKVLKQQIQEIELKKSFF